MRREEAKVEIKRRTRARLTKLERPTQTGHPCLLLGILDMLVPVREENITVHEHHISLLGTVRTNSHYSSLISHVLRSQCRTKDAARFVDHGYYIFFLALCNGCLPAISHNMPTRQLATPECCKSSPSSSTGTLRGFVDIVITSRRIIAEGIMSGSLHNPHPIISLICI